MATNSASLPTELIEELETIRSILALETRTDSQDGTIMVRLDLPRGEAGPGIRHEITFILSSSYPNSPPTILLDGCSPPSELEEQLDNLAESLQSTPALFSLYQAVAEWMEKGGVDILENSDTSTPIQECEKMEEFQIQTGGTSEAANVSPSLYEGMVHSLEEEKRLQNEIPESSPVAKKGKGKSRSDRKKDPSNDQTARKQTGENTGEKKEAMKCATDVIHRIIWDPELKSEHFTIGYLDRFVGIIEKPFAEFSWEDIASADLDVLAIPKHRIQYFKYKTEVVWDKNKLMDKVYGSRGTKVTIQEVIEEYEANHPQSKPKEETSKEVTESEPLEKPTPSEQETDALVELMMAESDEEMDDDVMGDVASFNATRVVSRKYKNKDRPNYFLCFKVTDAHIREQVRVLQEGVVSNCPMLTEACLPPNRLHVTLVMLRIDTEGEMCRAIEVIGNFQNQLVRILPQFNKIEISGVDCFRDQVIFGQVKANSALTRVASALKIQLEEAGIGTPGNHLPFKPHMTLIKLSRPISKKMNTTRINYTFYHAFREFHFGAQPVEQIILGSMFELSEEDGFYVNKFSVSNQVCCLRVDMTEIVLAQVLKNFCTSNRSLPCVKLIENILRRDMDKSTLIDQILSIIMHNETPVQQDRDVIIMRGLPGSGKSTLIQNSTEKQQNLVSICSADNFFTDSLTGEYRFDLEKLSNAHESCFKAFLENLIANKPLIVVDNTNSQLWEYSLYKCFAKCFAYKCSVLELFCANEDSLKQYHHRNKHNLSYDVIVAMRNRWENDIEGSVIDSRRLPTHSLLSLVSKKKESTPKSKPAFAPTKVSHYILLAVFLSQHSRNELIRQFPPEYANVNAGHVTLIFNPTLSQVIKFPLGANVRFNVLGCVSDERVQAAPIHFDSSIQSENAHPHVTISVSAIGHAKDSNDLLNRLAKKENLNNLPNRPDNMVLNGTVGIQVELTDGHSRRIFSTSELEALRNPKPPKPSKSSLSIDIYTGPSDLVTRLYIFDLDGTLVNTPGPTEGPGLYEKLTGSPWPHHKWIVHGESLSYPMSIHCSPGPALFQFFSHQSRSQSLTVIMTGRLETMNSSVREILSNFDIHPDLLLCKEDSSPLSTSDYKVLQLRKLLEQFPKVEYVKIWEDLAENLACFASMTVDYLDVEFELVDVISFQQPSPSAKKKPAGSTAKKSKAFQTARVYGKVQRAAYNDAVQHTISLISSLWASCISYQGPPEVLVHPFGSYPLKRMSDIDLCLLAPDKLTQIECIACMEKLLTQCGIECVHTSPCSRVPRISFLCSYTGTPDIQFDIIFMRMREVPEAIPGKLKEWKELISTDDNSSLTALEGLEFLRKVRQDLIKGMSEEDFAAVIELAVLVLRSKHQKGNAFHCVRTFHLIKVLLGLVEKKQIARSCLSSADQLLKEFLTQLAALSVEEWTGYLGEFVPIQYIRRIQDIFTECRNIANSPSFPSVPLYHKMLSPLPFPPPDHVAMEIEIECPSRCLQFRYGTIAEAKFGSVVRKMLESGVHLSPGPYSRSRICFSIPDIPEQVERCYALMKDFLADFEKMKHEVKIHFISQSKIQFDSPLNEAGLQGIFSQILEFASSDRTELSLPSNLQSHQRLLVYQFLEKHGLRHVTRIEGRVKQIIVRKA